MKTTMSIVFLAVGNMAIYAQAQDTQQQKKAAEAVINQMNRLLSAIEGGVNFGQYADLVIQTKMNADPYIAKLPDGHLKELLTEAMRAFIDARDEFDGYRRSSYGATSRSYSDRYVGSPDAKYYRARLDKCWDTARDKVSSAELYIKFL